MLLRGIVLGLAQLVPGVFRYRPLVAEVSEGTASQSLESERHTMAERRKAKKAMPKTHENEQPAQVEAAASMEQRLAAVEHRIEQLTDAVKYIGTRAIGSHNTRWLFEEKKPSER